MSAAPGIEGTICDCDSTVAKCCFHRGTVDPNMAENCVPLKVFRVGA